LTQFEKYDSEDQIILNNITKRMKRDAKAFSLTDTTNKITLTFHDVEFVRTETLKVIRLTCSKVFKIEINLKKKTVKFYIHKKNASSSSVGSKTSSILPTNKDVDKVATKWLNDKTCIREEDRKLVHEVVKTIVKWTWGQIACELAVEEAGDDYNFTVENIRKVTYNQCEQLWNLQSDNISSIRLHMGKNKATFKVTRTLTRPSKRRRIEKLEDVE